MAKKKIVEIKAQSEPVRGVGPDADPSDPVIILYPSGASEELIASLAGGDEDEAVIKTAGCIVPGDITIRYAAPASGYTLPEVTFVNSAFNVDVNASPVGADGSTFLIINDGNVVFPGDTIPALTSGSSALIIPGFLSDNYKINLFIGDPDHELDIASTLGTAEYEALSGGHRIEYSGSAYPSDFTVTISTHEA